MSDDAEVHRGAPAARQEMQKRNANHPESRPIFDFEYARLLRVRCSACDWSASGNAGTTGHGIAWAMHDQEAHR